MLDFFTKHKRVSGSISIMLAMLLLPIYSFIGLLVESARYQNAKEQLKELTFLGELAILADYVNFLYTDYDVFAFDAENAEASFEKYIKSATSAGGIDTTNLNKLLGIDMSLCSIEGMYCIADPTVLEYQIKQSGRYSMPVDILSKYTLKALFEDFNKRFKDINKKLGIMSDAVEAADGITKIVYNSKKIFDSTDKLKLAIDEYNAKHSAFVEKYNKVDWSKVNAKTLNNVLGKSNSDRVRADVDLKLVEDEIKEMESVKNDINNYFRKAASERADLKLRIDNKEMKVEDYLKDQAKDLEDMGLFDENEKITSYESYTKAIEKLKEEKTAIENFKTAYDSVPGIDEALKAYTEFKEAADDLNSTYGSYASTLRDFIGSVKDTIDSINSFNEAKANLEKDTLNEAGKNASQASVEVEKETDEEKKEQKIEDAKELAKKRKEAYSQAKEHNDYTYVGSNVLADFYSTDRIAKVNQWEQNLNKNVGVLPDIDSTNNGEEYVTEIEKIKKLNIPTSYKNLVSEFDFYSANGMTLNNGSDVEKDLKKLIAGTIIEKETNLEIDAEFDEENLKKIYDPLVNTSPDIEQKWFPTDNTNKTYYLSVPTVMIIVGFLGAEAKEEGSTDSKGRGLLDVIKTLIDAFANLSPDNALFNSHIGSSLSVPSNSQGITYPSQANFSDPQAANRKTAAHNFAVGAIGASGGKIDANTAVNYYADSSSNSVYDDIFGGRQPGQSIEDLVMAAGKSMSAIDSFARSLVPLRIIKLIFSIGDFVSAIVDLIKALIHFVGDIIQIISAIIDDLANGTIRCLTYIVDQLYIGYYAENHFTSRQSAEVKDYNVKNVFAHECSLKCGGNNGECALNETKFDAAEMEYILIGKPCEITNQRYTYYAIYVLRLLLNFTVVTTDKVVSKLMAIPIVGPFIPFIVDIFESKIDMMFLLFGENVPLVKSGLSITHLDDFLDHMSSILEKEMQAAKNGKMTYKMEKGADGKKYRKYNTESTNEQIKNKAKDDFGLNNKDNKSPKLDYNKYITILLLLYREDTKALRMADLMQMKGMEKDPTFDIKECYTYVYASVEARYSSLLPLMADGADFSVIPSLKDLQYNGY